MPRNSTSSKDRPSVAVSEGRFRRERLERLKARQQPDEATTKRIAKALKAVESLGVEYDRIDAETWRMIGQHPDLERF